ncbi:MAG: hypothetical protein ACRDZM_08455 [Acidimicrobiia bacterium]
METGADVTADDSGVSLRDLPRIARSALQLVWAAGPREFLVTSSLQMVNAAAIAVLLLLGQKALAALLDPNGSGLGSVAPWAVALALTAAAMFIGSAVQR